MKPNWGTLIKRTMSVPVGWVNCEDCHSEFELEMRLMRSFVVVIDVADRHVGESAFGEILTLKL